MSDSMTDGEPRIECEVPLSTETNSDPWPLRISYTQSIRNEPVEPGGDGTHAFRPGTQDPFISTALFAQTSAQDKDGQAQLDTAPATNAAMSSPEDTAWMDSMLKEVDDECDVAEREETPETGRGDERPLSEDDNMSLSPGGPADAQNTSPGLRVNSTRPSDMQVRPNSGPQRPQSYSPGQAPFGNFPPTPHQAVPYTSMPYHPTPRPPMPYHPTPRPPMPYHPPPRPPMPYRSLPHQSFSDSTPGNTRAAAGSAPSQPSLAAPRHEIAFNQLGNYGLSSDALMSTNRAGSASTTYGSGPFQAPPHPQMPSQNSSEGRPQARTPADTHNSMRPVIAADGSTTVYRNQVPAYPWPSPSASLPPNTNFPTPRRPLNRRAAGSGSEAMGMRDPQLAYTGFPPQSGSDYSPHHPSQLGHPGCTFQSQHATPSQSHERLQQYVPPHHSTTGSDTVINDNQQAMEQEVKKFSRELLNSSIDQQQLRHNRRKKQAGEELAATYRKQMEAHKEARETLALRRHKQSSSQGPPSATSRRVGGTDPDHLGTDASGSEVPRVTTPEAERMRESQPRMRHQPVLHVKIAKLAFKIMARQRRGQPYSRLPGVTAEDVQEFRLQYRSMPALIWTRGLPIPDDMVKATLQGMKLLGSSLEDLWQLRQPSSPAQSAQSASGTQSVSTTVSAQLPETTLPDDDGHVPEYLLDQFMSTLELRGEQEALRFLRESKAKAARGSRGSGSSRRKRSKAIMSMGDESLGSRGQLFTLDDIFDPGGDDPYGGTLAFGPMSSMGTVIDDDPSAFGITEIRNARGQIMVKGSSKRRENTHSSPALNRTIDIHIEDDLVGAAESSAPAEKFRRLMTSSPTPKSPKKKARK